MTANTKNAIQIHDPLTVDDLMRAVDMLAAAVDELGVDVLEDMQRKAMEGDRWTIGREVTRVALKIAPQHGRGFMAGLVDMSADEFGRQPVTAPLEIIEQLLSRDDISDFFGRARSLLPVTESDKNSANIAAA